MSRVTCRSMTFGTRGCVPVDGVVKLNRDDSTIDMLLSNGADRVTLIDPDDLPAGSYSAESDVRTGVAYGAGSYVGTCAVPAAGSVALGVAVDAGTGTAVLTAGNVLDAVGAVLGGMLP